MKGYKNLTVHPSLDKHQGYHKPHRKEFLESNKPVINSQANERPETSIIHKNPVALAIDKPYTKLQDNEHIELLRPPMTLPPAYVHQQQILSKLVSDCKQEKLAAKQLQSIENHKNRMRELENPPVAIILPLKFSDHVLIERAPIELARTKKTPAPKQSLPVFQDNEQELEEEFRAKLSIHQMKSVRSTSEDDIPDDVMRMSALQVLIDKHKASIAAERVKVPEYRSERMNFEEKNKNLFVEDEEASNETHQHLLSSMTFQTLKRLVSDETKEKSSETNTSIEKITLDWISENKSPEELLQMYLIAKHTHIEDVSGLTAYRHERFIECIPSSSSSPSADHIIQLIEEGKFNNIKPKKFLMYPILSDKLDSVEQERTKTNPANHAIKSAAPTGPVEKTNDPSYSAGASSAEYGQNSEHFNPRLLTLLSYLTRAGLLSVLDEYDGKDPSTFSDQIKFLVRLKVKPEQQTEDHQSLINLLNKTIIYTHAAISMATNETEKELFEALRNESVQTMWDINGISQMSRWCRKGFKEAIQHMMNSHVSSERYMGALIHINCLELDATSLRILLDFITDADQDKDKSVVETVTRYFEQGQIQKVMILDELLRVMNSSDYKMRMASIELCTTLSLSLITDKGDFSTENLLVETQEVTLAKSLNASTASSSGDIEIKFQQFVLKLVDFIWNDWNFQVQSTCKQCLNRLSLQETLNKSILSKMTLKSDSKAQIDALKAFISGPIISVDSFRALSFCLHSSTSQVREEACKAVSALPSFDDRVLLSAVLTRCSDPVSTVRNEAIRGLDCKLKRLTIALGQAVGLSASGSQVKETLYFAVHYEKYEQIKIQTLKTIQKLGLETDLKDSLTAIIPYETAAVRKIAEQILSNKGFFIGYTPNSINEKEDSLARNFSVGSADTGHTCVIFRPSLYESRTDEEKSIILREHLVQDMERQRLVERVTKLSTKKNIISEATKMVYQEVELRPLKSGAPS